MSDFHLFGKITKNLLFRLIIKIGVRVAVTRRNVSWYYGDFFYEFENNVQSLHLKKYLEQNEVYDRRILFYYQCLLIIIYKKPFV